MKILCLLKTAGVEKTSAYLEMINIFVQKEYAVDLIIASQPSNYVIEKFYFKKGINYKTLHTEESLNKIEPIKDILRKNDLIERICENIVLLIKKKKFQAQRKKFDDDIEFSYLYYLDEEMRKFEIEKDYDYIWVVDEYGILWAEWLKMKSNKNYKVIYHCLELYWEHFSLPDKKKWRYFDKYILFEVARKLLFASELIVIQDAKRWDTLCKYTGIDKNRKKILFPVSIQDYQIETDDTLRKKYHIGTERKIIFYPTLIAPKRGCIELVKIAQGLGVEFTLIIHGFSAIKGYIDKIRKHIQDENKIVLSNTSFTYQELLRIHKDVWCVFLFYDERDDNNKYIINSSNKLVMSLQAGKPIISIGNSMVAELCSQYKCGKALMNWSEEEFLCAISDLNQHYIEYCQNARRCYEERFNSSLFSEVLNNELIENQ